jgi:hypothetical protein
VGLRCYDRDAPAQPHDLDPVGELEDVGHVMADQDDRQPPVANPQDQVEHLARLFDAQRGRRLVHDRDSLRPFCSACDCDALPLPAGKVLDRLTHRLDADLQLL